MSFEYFIFIFFSSLAVFQIASTWRGLEYILFLKSKLLTYTLFTMMVIASYYRFFFLLDRHVRDTGGNQQLLFFPIGVLSSVFFTFLLSSLINAGKKQTPETGKGATEAPVSEGRSTPVSTSPVSESGLEILKEMTCWQAVRQVLLRR